MRKNTSQEFRAHNMLGKETKIVGNITAENDIRIDGVLEGDINCKGKIVVGRTGMIIGTIICHEADIYGQVKGILQISELLSIKESANIEGDILTKILNIEPKALFNGTCKMVKDATTKPTPHQ